METNTKPQFQRGVEAGFKIISDQLGKDSLYPNGCPILSDWEYPIHSMPVDKPQRNDL